MKQETPLETLSSVCDTIFDGINALDECLRKLERLLSFAEDAVPSVHKHDD